MLLNENHVGRTVLLRGGSTSMITVSTKDGVRIEPNSNEDIIAIKLEGEWELLRGSTQKELYEALRVKAIKNVAPEYVEAFTSTDEDMVNHPDHYGGEDNPVEAIKIIDHYELGFNLGNSLKYLIRADHKEDRLSDLKKCQWYLNREIAKMEK